MKHCMYCMLKIYLLYLFINIFNAEQSIVQNAASKFAVFIIRGVVCQRSEIWERVLDFFVYYELSKPSIDRNLN